MSRDFFIYIKRGSTNWNSYNCKQIGSFPERLKYRTNVILHNSASSNYEISELIKEISHELNKLKWSILCNSSTKAYLSTSE